MEQIEKLLEKMEELSLRSEAKAAVLDSLEEEFSILEERSKKEVQEEIQPLRDRLMDLLLLIKSAEIKSAKAEIFETEKEILEITKKLKAFSREKLEKTKS